MNRIHPGSELIFVRHAESEWNASGRWQGHADPPLSARGREQARRLAHELAGVLGSDEVDLLVCSDLQRTRQTAEALGLVLGLSCEADASLRELDVGSWSGLTREEIAELEPDRLARFEEGDPDVRPGGGETRREIRARANRSIRRLVRAHPGARILVVTHLGFIRALLPDCEPANVGLVRVGARDALTRRMRVGTGGSESGAGLPL